MLVGEKSSLRPVLGRVADLYGADLYLPNGEISDTQIHTMASRAAETPDRPTIDKYATHVIVVVLAVSFLGKS